MLPNFGGGLLMLVSYSEFLDFCSPTFHFIFTAISSSLSIDR